ASWQFDSRPVVKPVIGCQHVVSQKIESDAMESVGARPYHHVYGCAAAEASHISAEIRLYLKLLHGFHGWNINCRGDASMLAEEVHGNAVDHHVVAGIPPTIGDKVVAFAIGRGTISA